MAWALIKPPKNMVSATTKISMPSTPLGATCRRRAAGIFRDRCRTLPAVASTSPSLSVLFAVFVPFAMLERRVRLERALRFVLRRHVLPAPTAMVHHVRGDAGIEQE